MAKFHLSGVKNAGGIQTRNLDPHHLPITDVPKVVYRCSPTFTAEGCQGVSSFSERSSWEELHIVLAPTFFLT